jgi:DNA adenine methylase
MKPLEQYKKFPPSRYMGSKNKIITNLYNIFVKLKFNSALDLFSGSSSVSYLLKSMNKKVFSNDYMHFSANISKAIIENNNITLNKKDIISLIKTPKNYDKFVQKKFKNVFFSDSDNNFIDIVRHNIKNIKNIYKKSIALASLAKACQKKQPRGIFTYISDGKSDGRKDLKKSFKEQFLDAINIFNNAVFDNKKNNKSINLDFMDVQQKADLVYIDPPYFSKYSDNEYVRRYHFVEGIVRDWQGVKIQESSKVKKFKKYPSMFDSEKNSFDAIDYLIKKYSNSKIVLSYSSNSLPTLKEIKEIVKKNKKELIVKKINYTYSFGNQKKGKDIKNLVKEYIILIK